MLYPLPQSLQPSVRSLFFHLASLTPFVCLQNSQLLNAWQLKRGEQPLVQTLQASTLLPMHLCFLLKSPPRQSRVENCRQTTWLTFWIITSALTFQNKSVYVWVKSNINEECEWTPACSLWFICLMECHLYPHLTKEVNFNVYNLVSLTANPIKIPMKLSKTSEKRKLTCDLHFLQNHRFQDGRSEFLLRLKKCVLWSCSTLSFKEFSSWL